MRTQISVELSSDFWERLTFPSKLKIGPVVLHNPLCKQTDKPHRKYIPLQQVIHRCNRSLQIKIMKWNKINKQIFYFTQHVWGWLNCYLREKTLQFSVVCSYIYVCVCISVEWCILYIQQYVRQMEESPSSSHLKNPVSAQWWIPTVPPYAMWIRGLWL